MNAKRRRRPKRDGGEFRREIDFSSWMPRTSIGEKVKSGEIKTMNEFMKLSAPIKEVEIVDKLLPMMGEEVIDVGRVQRVTDSGRRMRFRVVVGVGNRNGYVGVGVAKGKEAGPTIRKAIERAKLNVVEIKRGCGSWECGCGSPHTVPFRVTGKVGSVSVTLSPAPRGTDLVSGEIARKILALAGISDVWVHTEGHTRTAINFSGAVLDALANTKRMKVKDSDVKSLNIILGEEAKKEETEEPGKEGIEVELKTEKEQTKEEPKAEEKEPKAVPKPEEKEETVKSTPEDKLEAPKKEEKPEKKEEKKPEKTEEPKKEEVKEESKEPKKEEVKEIDQGKKD